MAKGAVLTKMMSMLQPRRAMVTIRVPLLANLCKRGARHAKPSQGEVIAVGPGGRDEAGKLIPIDIKVGDLVLFGKWSGTEVKIDGIELLIMKESDIMGRNKPPAPSCGQVARRPVAAAAEWNVR